jgi:hypothetical protein
MQIEEKKDFLGANKKIDDKKRKRDEFQEIMEIEENSMFSNMSALDEILKRNNEQINEDSMKGYDDEIDKYLAENREAHVYAPEPKKLLNEESDFLEKYAIRNEAILTSNAEEIEDIKTGLALNIDYKVFKEADGDIFEKIK